MKHHRLAIAVLAATLGIALFAPDRADAATVGERCGGYLGFRCHAGLWCDLQPGMCGGRDIMGTCVRVTGACHYVYRPVCGCNGRTYGNDCQRRHARVAKSHDGACRGPRRG